MLSTMAIIMPSLIRERQSKTVSPKESSKNKGGAVSDKDFLLRQITVIKDTVNIMLKNAKYGNHQDFLKNARRIFDAASRLELHLDID